MKCNIIENIEVKDGKAFADIISNHKSNNGYINRQDLSELLRVNGEIGLYMMIIKIVLSGGVTFSDNGNITVRKLKRVTDSLITDNQYKEKRESINTTIKNNLKNQDKDKTSIEDEQRLDKQYNDLDNYISFNILLELEKTEPEYSADEENICQ